MRIFYAADSTPNPAIVSSLWRKNLLDSLRSLGHDVVEFECDLSETFRHLDPARPESAAFIANNRPRVTAELVRQVEAAHATAPVEVFFSYFYDACVEPAGIERIRSLGITSFNWYCNASYQFHLVSEIAPHYDYCLVPERERMDHYRRIGAHPLYCQEAANPAIYRPSDVAQEFDVTFVGQCYGDRADHVKWLLSQGIDIRVWGPRWEYHVAPRSRNPLRRWLQPARGLPAEIVGGVLTDEELVAMYSRSRINVGFSTCGDTDQTSDRIVQIRLRDFEVPMSGGFYLVEHQDELANFFEIGQEIETYRTREELRDKIRYYLRHDAERERVGRAGRERCLKDHTWARRFEVAFREAGMVT